MKGVSTHIYMNIFFNNKDNKKRDREREAKDPRHKLKRTWNLNVEIEDMNMKFNKAEESRLRTSPNKLSIEAVNKDIQAWYTSFEFPILIYTYIIR